MSTIITVLMVKNESHVIERCLESVSQISDFVLIMDTGSSDNTIIKAGLFLQNLKIPYKIYIEEFKNFGYNRTRLLELASFEPYDYVLMIDADDRLLYPLSSPMKKNLQNLTHDYYDIDFMSNGLLYQLPKLTKNKLQFKYVGVTHEYLDTTGKQGGGTLKGFMMQQLNDGYRRINNIKVSQDIELLEKELQENLQNPRTHFYLALSYLAINDYLKAYNHFTKRTQLGGWNEEIFYSYYQLGKVLEYLNYDSSLIVFCYLKAYDICPSRIESLWQLRKYWERNGSACAKLLDLPIKTTLLPKTGLFLETEKYERNSFSVTN